MRLRAGQTKYVAAFQDKATEKPVRFTGGMLHDNGERGMRTRRRARRHRNAERRPYRRALRGPGA